MNQAGAKVLAYPCVLLSSQNTVLIIQSEPGGGNKLPRVQQKNKGPAWWSKSSTGLACVIEPLFLCALDLFFPKMRLTVAFPINCVVLFRRLSKISNIRVC